MGDLATSSSSSQQTTHRDTLTGVSATGSSQVGAGTGAAIGGGAGSVDAINGVAIGPIRGGKGAQTINIQSLDIDALHEASSLATAGLAAGVATANRASDAAENVSLHAIASNQNLAVASLAANQSAQQTAAHFATDVSLAALESNQRATNAALTVGDNAIQSSLSFASHGLDAFRSFSEDALDTNRQVSLQAVNSANQVGINALQLASNIANRNSDTTSEAVADAQHIALNATPVSPGAYAEAAGAQFSSQVKIAIIGAIAAGVIGWLLTGKSA